MDFSNVATYRFPEISRRDSFQNIPMHVIVSKIPEFSWSLFWLKSEILDFTLLGKKQFYKSFREIFEMLVYPDFSEYFQKISVEVVVR